MLDLIVFLNRNNCFVGVKGLKKAISKFDPEKGEKRYLPTYLCVTIFV